MMQHCNTVNKQTSVIFLHHTIKKLRKSFERKEYCHRKCQREQVQAENLLRGVRQEVHPGAGCVNKVAWHAGCKAGNNTSIGIEVIPKNAAGEFSDRSIATLKELLDSLPHLPIVRHYDWTGKACPAYYTNNDKWQELLKKLGR